MTDLMNVFRAADIRALPQFIAQNAQLAIVERDAPKDAEAFLQKLMETLAWIRAPMPPIPY